MEPGSQRVAHPERAGLADEREKGRLECVFGLVLVAQDRPAGVQDDRSVPFDQGREGEFSRLPALGEPFQKLPVGHVTDRPEIEQHAERPAGRGFSPCCQSLSPPEVACFPPDY